MQTTLIAAPAFVAFVAGLFSLGGADPSAQAAAIAALQSPSAVASVAPDAPALFRVRGEWVAVGTKELHGLGPADSVSPSGQYAGASLGRGLTFTGVSAVAVKHHGDGPAPMVVALYAAERPGLAFIVSPPLAGSVVAAVPAAPAMDYLPISALPRGSVHRPAA